MPHGILASFDGAFRWIDHPADGNCVLIGDPVSTTDPVWGHGFSRILRDVRLRRDRLLNDTTGFPRPAPMRRITVSPTIGCAWRSSSTPQSPLRWALMYPALAWSLGIARNWPRACWCSDDRPHRSPACLRFQGRRHGVLQHRNHTCAAKDFLDRLRALPENLLSLTESRGTKSGKATLRLPADHFLPRARVGDALKSSHDSLSHSLCNDAGLIAGVHTIDRENDEDAMSAGSLLLKGTSFARIEVWEGCRCVGSAEQWRRDHSSKMRRNDLDGLLQIASACSRSVADRLPTLGQSNSWSMVKPSRSVRCSMPRARSVCCTEGLTSPTRPRASMLVGSLRRIAAPRP
jgi:hypothetical protein